MRCADVIRELTVPTGRLAPEDRDAHLAGCPRCAAESRRQARVAQLWAATRPVEPAPAVWETVWARVSDAADPAPVSTPPMRLKAPDQRWKRVAIVALGLAQAAAILVAVWASRPGGAPSQPRLAEAVTPHVELPELARVIHTPEVNIASGQTDLIRFDREGEIKVVSLNVPDENSNSVDSNFVMLGILEAMAE